MIRAPFAIGATAGTWLIGQTVIDVPGMPGWAGIFANLSATVLLLGLFCWVLTKEMPRKRKENADLITKIVDKHTAALDKITEVISKCRVNHD